MSKKSVSGLYLFSGLMCCLAGLLFFFCAESRVSLGLLWFGIGASNLCLAALWRKKADTESRTEHHTD